MSVECGALSSPARMRYPGDDLRREFTALLHCCWALKAITGGDPVPEGSQGKLSEMAWAWLDWGRRHGYAWEGQPGAVAPPE